MNGPLRLARATLRVKPPPGPPSCRASNGMGGASSADRGSVLLSRAGRCTWGRPPWPPGKTPWQIPCTQYMAFKPLKRPRSAPHAQISLADKITPRSARGAPPDDQTCWPSLLVHRRLRHQPICRLSTLTAMLSLPSRPFPRRAASLPLSVLTNLPDGRYLAFYTRCSSPS
jgi:hypothetical protein